MDVPYHAQIIDTAQKKEQAVKREHLRHSRWLVTVNTNKVFDPDNEDSIALYNKLKETLDEMMKRENIPRWIQVTKEGDELTKDKVKNISIEGGIEKQGRRGMLHCHVYISVAHYTRLRLNYEDLKRFFVNELGIGNVFFSVQMYRSNSDHLEKILSKYISKEISLTPI